MSSLGRRPAFVRERVKGFLVSCSQAVEDGPPLCPPSVQRSWGSGVCRERLCDVTGLLWLGCPALLSPIPGLFSADYCLCSPVPQNTFVIIRKRGAFRLKCEGFMDTCLKWDVLCLLFYLWVSTLAQTYRLWAITHPCLRMITKNNNLSSGVAGLLLQ